MRTLALHIGDIGELDGRCDWLDELKEYRFGDQRPAKDDSGAVALLAASGVSQNETFYLIVGALLGARLVNERRALKFDMLERFLVPILVSRARGEERRDDLLGEVVAWSPSEFYWLPESAGDQVLREARALVIPSDVGRAGRPPRDSFATQRQRR